MEHRATRRGVSPHQGGASGRASGRASVGELSPADATEVPAARCVAFVRTLLRGHYARADGRCACGHWQAACPVRILARTHGIPVDPVFRTGLRVSPAAGAPADHIG